MKHLLLVGHGHFASGLKSGLVMITGMDTSIDAFDFTENDDLLLFRDRLIDKIRALSLSDEEFCIGVDLLGGTPFITAGEIFSDLPEVKMLVGINLPTALEYLLSIDPVDKLNLSGVEWFQLKQMNDTGGI
jgi:N-acetylgalactosamine PTS system EIIA component